MTYIVEEWKNIQFYDVYRKFNGDVHVVLPVMEIEEGECVNCPFCNRLNFFSNFFFNECKVEVELNVGKKIECGECNQIFSLENREFCP